MKYRLDKEILDKIKEDTDILLQEAIILHEEEDFVPAEDYDLKDMGDR
jgi:hypothetical protein